MRQGQALFSSRHARNKSVAWAALYPATTNTNTVIYVDGNDWLQVIAAVVGALLAGLISFFIFKLQRSTDHKSRIEQEIIKNKTKILATMHALHRERIKTAEVEISAQANLLRAKFLKVNPNHADTIVKDWKYFMDAHNYSAQRMDTNNDRAADYTSQILTSLAQLSVYLPKIGDYEDLFIGYPEDMSVTLPQTMNSIEQDEALNETLKEILIELEDKYTERRTTAKELFANYKYEIKK